MKKNKPHSNSQQGIAVILAMATMVLVVTAALELHIDERNNMMSAAVMRDRITLEEMATSAIHLGMAMLIRDRMESETDSLQEDWGDNETIATLVEEIPFELGKVVLEISDELSKIQINALVQFPEGRQFNQAQVEIWQRFGGGLISAMELVEGADTLSEDKPDPLTIINSLKDWLDSGDDDAITGLNGAESDYYQDLDPPYKCKNAPFDDLSEVRLVKGITPELFSGIGGGAGLAQYITVFGAEAVKGDNQKFSFPGKININTAGETVLMALVPIEYAEFVPVLVEHREATSGDLYTNDLTKPNWYKNVPGFAEANINPELYSIASQFFSLTATATLDNLRVVTTAVVERVKSKESEPWQCKVLNWKTE